MSLYIKDLEIWSLSLACALNNDSLSTDMLYRAIYRYTAFVIVPHSSMVFMFDAENALESMLETYLKKEKKREMILHLQMI